LLDDDLLDDALLDDVMMILSDLLDDDLLDDDVLDDDDDIYIWYIVCDGVFHCFFPSQKGCPNVLPRGQHWDAERLYSVGLSTVASRGWGHRRQRSLCRNECAKCS
jgi:hypothetical protein